MMQAPDNQPGNYYVSVAKGADYRLLAGPFVNDHSAALAMVDKAREIALDMDPRASWYSYGTCRLPIDGAAPAGILNKQCGVQ